MKIKVKIGPNEHNLADTDKHQLIREIVELRKEGPVCVLITILGDGIELYLPSGECNYGGGGREPSQKELEIIQLWKKHGLNGKDFAPGQLNAFLKQVA